MYALKHTDFQLPYHTTKYAGKVRDVYTIEAQVLALVATDRISAFDCILPRTIPGKGEILNRMSAFFLERTQHICPNHLLTVPDPNITLARLCEPYPIEVIIRGHLSGHAWRLYKQGQRSICGQAVPDGLKQHDPLPEPIITPTTKSKIGHDIDITEPEIIRSGLIPAEEWALIKHYAFSLYKFGSDLAKQNGLLLADTKYEFGSADFEIFLIDEIHTPDSSRYYLAEGFEERQAKGEPQPQFSKEFVREWLMAEGFMGNEGESIPTMTDDIVTEIFRRYAFVYQTITGELPNPRVCDATTHDTMQQNLCAAIAKLGIKSSIE